MPIHDSVDIKIEFYHLDPMNVVWHGNYARFLERARCAVLERLDYSYDRMAASGYAFPIVDMRTKYIRPISFGQVIKVLATLVEWENRIRFDYVITDRESRTVLSKAQTTQMAVHMESQETAFVCPDEWLQKVAAVENS